MLGPVEEKDMLGVSDGFREARQPIDRLIELVDHEFNDTEWSWNEFLNHWEKDFTLDVTTRGKGSKLWLPSDKQQAHIRSVVAKLEFRIKEIREYYM